jgi:putative ABC transport system ATP-binding protein
VLSQSANLLDHLSVRQNILIAQSFAPNSEHPFPEDLLAEVGLSDRATARPSTLSGGEAARAGLAVALANDPPILLADEPTGEVDERNEQLLLDLLRQRAALGAAIVFVTHSDRAAHAADRVVGLHDGRLDR